MSEPKGDEVLGFLYYLESDLVFYTCQDQVVTYTEYINPDTGAYFDPFYDVGNGTFSNIGEQFQQVNWEEAGTIALIVLGYVALAVAGFFVFPPFAICLVLTEGNLNDCSMGIWGNGYATDQTKFETSAEAAAPTDTSANNSAETYTVDTAAA